MEGGAEARRHCDGEGRRARRKTGRGWSELEVGGKWQVHVDAGERSQCVVGGLLCSVRMPMICGEASCPIGCSVESVKVPGQFTRHDKLVFVRSAKRNETLTVKCLRVSHDRRDFSNTDCEAKFRKQQARSQRGFILFPERIID